MSSLDRWLAEAETRLWEIEAFESYRDLTKAIAVIKELKYAVEYSADNIGYVKSANSEHKWRTIVKTALERAEKIGENDA